MKYSYAQGNKISKPNTYFYTQFQGSEFIDLFYENRKNIINLISEAEEPIINVEKKQDIQSDIIQTSAFLKSFQHECKANLQDADKIDFSGIDLLLKKFEVSKKIYDSYHEGLNNRPESSFSIFSHYINFALILNYSYCITKKLNYLNGMLKIIDTLISIFDELSKKEKQNLSWLILREIEHIQSLQKGI